MSNIAQIPPEMMPLMAAGIAKMGGLPTRQEAQIIGTAEPICTIDSNGKVNVHPKIQRMRRRALWQARRRPPLRRSTPRIINRPARARVPRRRRAAGTMAAASRDGPGDSDGPPPAAITDVSNADRGSRRHGEAAAMGQLVRFRLRNVAAVFVCKARSGEWLALAGSHGWSFGSRDEAHEEAEWLSRNLGLPVRELIGGAAP